MKAFYFFPFFLIIFFAANSQEEENPSNTIIRLKVNRIIGKVTNAAGKPVEAATVQLFAWMNGNAKTA